MTRQHIIICGGGLVGLVLGQALKKLRISYAIYEAHRDVSVEQGWAVTIYWSLSALQQLLPKEIFDALDTVVVNPYLAEDDDILLSLNARNLEVFQISNIQRIRANRQRLRDLLLTGLSVKFGKKLVSYEITSNAARANFADGTFVEGSLLVGCDGSKSTVRRQLLGPNSSLQPLPIQMHGVTQSLTAIQATPLLRLNPELFMARDPDTGVFLWHSICDVSRTDRDSDGDEYMYQVQTLVSNLVSNPSDSLGENASNLERLNDMKKRAKGWAEPLWSLVRNIPEGTKVIKILVADWIPEPWEGRGHVTLAGDAAGPMTMFRGDGANHGFIDAACLASAIMHIEMGRLNQPEALAMYESEVIERRKSAVPLSRKAAIIAHCQGIPSKSSLPETRSVPQTALRQFFGSASE